jgi:hypothetical protein
VARSDPRSRLRSCPIPSPVFTGRKDILAAMHVYFSTDIGGRHVYVLCGVVGVGKSQIVYKFIEECQVDISPGRYVTVSRTIEIPVLTPESDSRKHSLSMQAQSIQSPRTSRISPSSKGRGIRTRTLLIGLPILMKSGCFSSMMLMIRQSAFAHTSRTARMGISSSPAEIPKRVPTLARQRPSAG